MAFEHAAATQWGRGLRAVLAGRSPGVQVVGQPVEDALRAVIIAADVQNLTTPIRWAQAAVRASVGAVAAQVSRVELQCLSPGGLWVQDVDVNQDTVFTVIDAPLTTPDRVGIQDFGNIDTVSLVGLASIAEANPSSRFPVYETSAGSVHSAVLNPGLFLPFGKVLAMLGRFQNGAVEVKHVTWLEIPAAT